MGIDQLREQLRCPVITSDDDGYDEARAVHNGMFDRRPRAVVRAEQVADVMAAVNFARENGLDLAVRGGGHSAPGFGSNDDGVVIDLSLMRHVHVDPRPHRAGGRGRDVGRLQLRNPRLRPGDNRRDRLDHRRRRSHLGGGIGYLTRGYGLSIDNLLSADLVTADGRPVRASKTENDDLFWAIRGGGGNFGVATSFEFQLHPIDTVTVGLFFYELDHAGDLFRFWREWIKDAPETYGGFPAFQIAPPLPFVPDDRHGDTFAIAVVHFTGPIEAGDAAMAPFRELAPRVGEMVAPMPYPWLNSAFDAIFPKGIRSYWKGNYVTELTDAAIEAHLVHGPNVPEVSATMHLYSINGAAHRVAADETAFATGTPRSRPSTSPPGRTAPSTTRGSSGCASTTRQPRRTRSRAATSTSCRTTTRAGSRTTTWATTPGSSTSNASTTRTTCSTATRTSSRKSRASTYDNGSKPGTGQAALCTAIGHLHLGHG